MNNFLSIAFEVKDDEKFSGYDKMVSLEDIDIIDIFASIALILALFGVYDVFVNQNPVSNSVVFIITIFATGGYGIARLSGDRAGFNVTGGVRFLLVLLLGLMLIGEFQNSQQVNQDIIQLILKLVGDLGSFDWILTALGVNVASLLNELR